MVQLSDIHSLTDFLRNHKEHIDRLRKAGRPEVLTVNGKAALVVQDAKSYQKLLDALDYKESVEGILRGLDDVMAGKTRPAAKLIEDMRKQSKSSPSRRR
jgi:PHD/YefM family antitoxin component YafN of YafNO toxin-antitoxin module